MCRKTILIIYIYLRLFVVSLSFLKFSLFFFFGLGVQLSADSSRREFSRGTQLSPYLFKNKKIFPNLIQKFNQRICLIVMGKGHLLAKPGLCSKIIYLNAHVLL